MSKVFGRHGPAFPRLGKLAFTIAKPGVKAWFAANGMHTPDSRYAQGQIAAMREKLGRGETVYLIGTCPSGHNSGIALIEASAARGIRLISNEEEERFTGIKHYDGFPAESIKVLKRRLDRLQITPADIHACVCSWNYVDMVPYGLRLVCEHFPFSWPLLRPASGPKCNFLHAYRAGLSPARIGKELGLGRPMPVIAMSHHDNHAAFSFAVSPFNRSEKPVMISVLDGFGDSGAISLYVAEKQRLRCLFAGDSWFDSLGVFYTLISSTQGGWTSLSSEGRYMGAAAWGDNNRMTNPYYRRLRQIFYFGAEGTVLVNRAMTNWQNTGEIAPYKQALKDVIGEPIPPERQWNPDAVLRVEDVEHSPVTRDRVDIAAAVQLVFEDALFHIVDHLIRTTKSDQLVLTGGTALNCVANMRLLEHFDEDWYRRNLGIDGRLKIWVPPTPGDAGAGMGAAYNFAMQAGARPGEVMRHAFYCGEAPGASEIKEALESTEQIGWRSLGNVSDAETLDSIADFAASIVARDGVLGFFQGVAETGPRALGHRSIVANPCNPRTLENINRRVKFRESVRPLAPLVTMEAARRFFDLSPGATADDYNAYSYMVLTVNARPEAYAAIPAVIHKDGTARIQIVRPDIDPFTYAYLKALGRRVDAEVSVNTSLNVGSPIVQSPRQALETLKRAKAMTGLIMIAAEGDAFLAWHAVVDHFKDGGKQVLAWLEEWEGDRLVST